MKKLLALLVFAAALPSLALAAGGKASRAHEQAKAAKQAADAEIEAAKTDPVKAAEREKEKVVWVHRPVRHKQTMPAAPAPRGEDEKTR